MATLNFGVADPNMDLSVQMNIADDDLPRIMAYLMSTDYGRVQEDESTRDATQEEVAHAFARGILRGLLDQTVRYEREQAAKTAAAAIEDITPV